MEETWRYKVSILLSSDQVLEVCEGKVREPVLEPEGGDTHIAVYNLVFNLILIGSLFLHSSITS